ncbi:hypothetical protein SNEBB_001357 [Seison nebaliae]|nr:hypothetical protein SNEBB_001357 [Seison nebaliae]
MQFLFFAFLLGSICLMSFEQVVVNDPDQVKNIMDQLSKGSDKDGTKVEEPTLFEKDQATEIPEEEHRNKLNKKLDKEEINNLINQFTETNKKLEEGTDTVEGNCNVCIRMLRHGLTVKKFAQPLHMELYLRKVCAKSKGKRRELCETLDYIDGAIDYTLIDVSKPLTESLNPTAVCKNLSKKKPKVCMIMYEKEKIEWDELESYDEEKLKKLIKFYALSCPDCSTEELRQKLLVLKPEGKQEASEESEEQKEDPIQREEL